MNENIPHCIILPSLIQGWHSIKRNGTTYHIGGSANNVDEIDQTIRTNIDHPEIISQLLKNEKSFHSYIIECKDFIFASVDRIKSYPLFYGIDQGTLYVSNCPYTIKKYANINPIDKNALLEFSMSSYTLSSSTLYHSLYQLQAGEFLLWNQETKQLKTHRYYQYIPNPKNNATKEQLIDEHSSIMDSVIQRSIDKANGRPIVVPLSGGLDSRIILAKLSQMKYDNLRAISYGVPGNFEMKRAKQVAKTLNVPWKFIPAKTKSAKEFYSKEHRLNYAKFISALHTVPSYLEYETFYYLKNQNIIPDNSVIINGQTGDFISGGHLPRTVLQKSTPNFEDLFNDIIKKHFSLWKQLLNKKNLAYIRQRIIESLPKVNEELTAKDQLMAQYECWEWQERQCKAVVKGQRVYDFFGYDWDLPLWDPALMDFWERVPFEWKANQQLYIDYLRKYNKQLFMDLRPSAQPWTRKFKWIPVVAKLYGLLFGENKKSDYYKRMYYYGTDYNQFALIGRKFYLAHYKNTHGFGPFLVSMALKEESILGDSPIPETEPI